MSLDLFPRWNLISFIDGEEEIMPGVSVKVFDGPARGNQVVLIERGSERIAYAGDLIPTSFHLHPSWISACDEFPNETLAQNGFEGTTSQRFSEAGRVTGVMRELGPTSTMPMVAGFDLMSASG